MPMDKKMSKDNIPTMKIKGKVTVKVKPKAKVTMLNPKTKPSMPKEKGPATKPKGLNDYLDKGMTPPSKNKKLPSDADVILKGYNDKKTIAKFKESKKKGKK